MRRPTLPALAVVPVLLLGTAALLHRPYYAGGLLDPAYVYLLNALNVARLIAPVHVDHPGTPLQLLAAGALWVHHGAACLGDTCPDLVTAVLTAPEAYLTAINAVLNVLVAAAVLALGWRLRRATGSLLPALAGQATVAAFGTVPRFALPNVSPEPLLVAVTCLLLVCLAPLAFGPEPGAPAGDRARPWLAGGVLGLGVATKLTFVPLVGLVLLFRGARARLAALGACAAAFVLCTLPILPSYPYLFHWVERLSTHQGLYGRGPAGLPDPATLARNLETLVRGEPMLFVTLLAYGVVLVAVARAARAGAGPAPRLGRVLLVFGAVVTVQIAITLKQPRPHYLLPAMVATALPNALLADLTRRWGAARRGLRPAAVAAVFLVLGWGVALAAAGSLAQWRRDRGDRAAWETVRAAAPGPDPCLRFYYYGGADRAYALHFGNSFAGWRYAGRLEGLYPDRFFFQVWGDQFGSWGGAFPTAQVTDVARGGGCVLLVGARLKPPERARMDREFGLSVLDERGPWGAYRVTGTP